MSVAIPVVASWNGDTRRIFLKSGVTTFHWLDDIYAEYRHWRRTDENARKWEPFLRAAGNEPKGGGKFTPRYLTLLAGARLVPFDENILLTVTGEAITDNADTDPDPFDTSTRTSPLKLYITPPAAEIVRDVKSLEAIGHMEFGEVIHIDTINGVSGTNYTVDGYQIGTQRYPSNNLTDTKTLCSIKGFDTIHVIKNLEVGATESISGYDLVGEGAENSIITLVSGCSTHRTTFEEMSVSGKQSGETHYKRCEIGALENVHCIFNQCRLIGPMTMSQTSSDTTSLFQCYSAEIAGAETIIDMNNSRVSMVFNDYNGKIKFINMNHISAGVIVVNGNAGRVTVDSTCSTGTIKVRGGMELVDNSTGTLVDADVIANLVWQHIISGGIKSAEQMIYEINNAGGSLTNEQNTKLMSLTNIDLPTLVDAVWDKPITNGSTVTMAEYVIKKLLTTNKFIALT